mgnify:CR=1 FL=1
MYNSLLNPRSIQSCAPSFIKMRGAYGSFRGDAEETCTLQEVISYLKRAASFFDGLAQSTSNQKEAEVCQVIKANLLYIANDHLTDHPNEPLYLAEKKCIVQVYIIIDDFCEKEEVGNEVRQQLYSLRTQMTAVMDYFNLWKWVEEEINGTSEQEPSPAKIKPSNTSENNSYSPDPEIQRLISELENSQETSLKTIIKPYEEKRDYYAKLNNLIGLNGVKDALDKQIAAFRFQKERQKIHPDLQTTLSFNCLFLGNPGTGKTTVARELAGILRREGLLKSGHYVEVKAADIISPYIGMSGKNAQLAVYKAIDGLLFIDEAYSIAGHEGNKGSATNEVIDALTPLMENYRDRLCVVLAGYGKEMTQLIEKTNTGFSSRFQNTIQFENYNAVEMMKIFRLMTNERHLKLTSEADRRMNLICECFEEASTRIATFANARTLRNFREKIEARMGKRFQMQNQAKTADKDTIIVSDTELSDAEIWSVLGVVKQSADAMPYKGNDYVNHLRELLGLQRQTTSKTPSQHAPIHQPDGLHGVLMTDSKQLAVKFYDRLLSKEEIEGKMCEIYWPDYLKETILLPYIKVMRSQGIDYTLLDIADEEYEDILSQGHTWQNCARILDRFCEKNPEYIGGGLFIVGGQDIIPSPIVANPYWMTEDDKTKEIHYREQELEADLLFAYRSDEIRFLEGNVLDCEHFLCSNLQPRFAIGRLPMENGVVNQERQAEILGYFKRAVNSFLASTTKPLGIEIKNHLVTAAESFKLIAHVATQGLPLLPVQNVTGLVEENIFISPRLNLVERDDKEKYGEEYFRQALKRADMLTFISHGASYADGDGCYGEGKDGEHGYTAFLPELLQICPAKAIGSGCCWGARYIDYRVEKSMLLSAMAKDALIYIGACRSAIGCGDDAIKAGYDLIGCDALLSKCEHYLAQGFPAGIALHNAKMQMNMQLEGNIALLTILEFNLFGDPLLSFVPMIPQTDRKILENYHATEQDRQVLADMKTRTYESENIQDESEMSLLDRIRQRTSANLTYIRDKVNKEVYAQYGLKPQELSSIVTVKKRGYSDGYIFRYTRNLVHFEKRTIVHTDANGKIIFVVGTR